MSPTRFLFKSPRWASTPLALATLSILLHHTILVHAINLIHSQTIQPLYDTTPASTLLGWDDAAPALKYDSIITTGSQSLLNQSSLSITPWHPRTIEYSDLTKIATIQEGRLEIVHHPALGTQPVLVKKAALPEYIGSIARETEFYRLLDGLGVTPLFLGHVVEAGVVTGFIAEYVDQPQEEMQHMEDRERSLSWSRGTEACLSALRRMHEKRIAHGDAHCGNCLVRGDGSAVIVDFELAEQNAPPEEIERDLWVMKHSRDLKNET